MENAFVRKITFDRDLTEKDFRDIREMFGDKVVQEGTRHIVVAFDNGMDFVSFVVATGQITVTDINEVSI